MIKALHIVEYLIEVPLLGASAFLAIQSSEKYARFFGVLKQESPDAKNWMRLFFTNQPRGYQAVSRSPSGASETCRKLEADWRKSRLNAFLIFAAAWIFGAVFSFLPAR